MGRVRYRIVATGKTITQVYYSSYEGGLTNAESDARLIAAAPDLLEALKKYVEHFCDPLQCARAAIAKATGEPA
jgi:hypothetical protein